MNHAVDGYLSDYAKKIIKSFWQNVEWKWSVVTGISTERVVSYTYVCVGLRQTCTLHLLIPDQKNVERMFQPIINTMQDFAVK